MKNKIYDNEKWWQENGLQWVKEVETRRKSQPLYGSQEIVLSDYFSSIPNGSKVLEFGAGFGRHAKYLSKLKNIEYYAVDQSPTMLEALNVYCEEKINKENIRLIEPRQRLPFPDDYFDVVFTVSVLIHISPEHVIEIIDELKRVAKHVILHFENNYTIESSLHYEDHNGCWKHAIQDLYTNIMIYNNISSEQTLYYIDLDNDSKYKFNINEIVLDRIKLMGDKLGEGFKVLEGEVGWRQKELEKRETDIRVLEGEVGWRQNELEKKEEYIRTLQGEVGWRQNKLEEIESNIRILEGEIGWRQKKLEEIENNVRTLEGEVGWRQNELEKREEEIYGIRNTNDKLRGIVDKEIKERMVIKTNLDAVNNELNAIYQSNSWKLISKIKSIKLLNIIGKRAINIYKSTKKMGKSRDSFEENNSVNMDTERIVSDVRRQFSNINIDKVVAITHKNWLGVKNSTKELFDTIIELEELNDYQQVVEIGNMVIDNGVKKIVMSGFASGWNTLCSYIKQKNNDIEIIVFWHGNTTHMYEDYSWIRYQEILQLAKDKHIDKIAFAKKSMCDVYENMGLNVCMINNHVNKKQLRNANKQINNGFCKDGIRIGIYSSGGTWNKNAYTQIAAASLFENATVSMVPYNDRMSIFATQLGLTVKGFTTNISRDELVEEMSKNDINFYVTFSECAPLVPLESLNSGVICITANNHHYFEESELEKFIVVNKPDNPVEIYKKAVYALKNRDHILNLYNDWYNNNKIKAEKTLIDLK